MRFYFIFAFAWLFAQATPAQVCTPDIHSYSNFCDVRVTFADITWIVNPNSKTFAGSVTWSFERLNPNANQLVLDIKKIKVKKVKLLDKRGVETLADYATDNTDYPYLREYDYLGTALTIKLTPNTDKVKIEYDIESDAPSLSWTQAFKTVNGKEEVVPFLFTQCEAMNGRALLPIQDVPSVKFKYKAKVTVPKGMMALMSASDNPTEKKNSGIYDFEGKYAISPYLIALGVGDFTFKPVGKRTGIYAEPDMIEAAAWEFDNLEAMLDTAETIMGSYPWVRYDVLILPRSYHYGGMENPCLTFANGELITGTRSRIGVICHELAHSWSGNLVTHQSWSDIALTEGLTDYLENRLVEALYGKEVASLARYNDYKALLIEMEELGDEFEPLKIPLLGANPDEEGFSGIAYIKGHLFFAQIEAVIGRTRMNSYLKDYFKNFAWKSISSEEFQCYLNTLLSADEKKLLKTRNWFYNSGIPMLLINFDSTLIVQTQKLYAEWKNNTNQFIASGKYKEWNGATWDLFLDILYADTNVNSNQFAALFELLNRNDNRIMQKFYMSALKHNYNNCLEDMQKFLRANGRGKTIVSVYKAWAKKDTAAAKAFFSNNRLRYHPEIQAAIESIFEPQ